MARGAGTVVVLGLVILTGTVFAGPAWARSHPDLTEYFASLTPAYITAGADGNLWFTSDFDNKIGRITPAGDVTLFPTPTSNSFPLGITLGPDGNVWFTEASGNRIGRITPAGKISEFLLPTTGAYPRDIAAGADGNLWFRELLGSRVGRITVTGRITEYPTPTPDSGPVGITHGPDGRVWFTEAYVDQIGQVTPAGVVSELRLPASHRTPIDLTIGPDGNVWVTEPGTCCISGHLAVIAADGTITEFEVSGDPSGIMSFRGALWFTEPNNDLIGRMTTFGSVTFRDVPGRGNVPDGIAAGPHGTVWFCENHLEIGVITLDRSS